MFFNLILLTFTVFTCCETNTWNGIVPLKSTRADVEKILGTPLDYSRAKYAAAYNTKTARVSVIYSTGSCSVKPNNGWNVPELTVVSIFVEPNEKPKFSKIKIDESRFKRSEDPEVLGMVHYTNEKDGISLTVNSSEDTVASYSYFPKSKEDFLKCPE